MAIHIRDAETDRLVRHLAKRNGTGITGAIRLAVSNEIRKIEGEPEIDRKINALVARIKPRIKPTRETDKEFWDDMCGEP